MTKLQFTAQMFECCIRDDVHIVAQKHYEAWYAECEKQSDKLAKYEKALKLIELLNSPMGFSGAPAIARQALADETKELKLCIKCGGPIGKAMYCSEKCYFADAVADETKEVLSE